MGIIRIPKQVKLFAGVFSSDLSMISETKRILERTFGGIDYESAVMDFSQTDYYRDEFGDNLKRQFFGFYKSVRMENIYKVKILTNRMEARLSTGDKRIVNIDPGYLTLSKVVLLTTKDYAHRIYLARGIYAEVTLYYRNGTFNPWNWTYPDYQTKDYLDIFNRIRDAYHKEGGSAC